MRSYNHSICMDMMNKMTSGMSGTDKGEMKMIDKIAAMPAAQRKNAMHKMSSTNKAVDPGKMSGDM